MRRRHCETFARYWREIASGFLKLGATAYGGPAIMGIMQAKFQEKRQWVPKARFVEGLSLANMVPGATATQLGIFLGHVRGGWWGAGGTVFHAARLLHHARARDDLRIPGSDADDARWTLWLGTCGAGHFRGGRVSSQQVRGDDSPPDHHCPHSRCRGGVHSPWYGAHSGTRSWGGPCALLFAAGRRVEPPWADSLPRHHVCCLMDPLLRRTAIAHHHVGISSKSHGYWDILFQDRSVDVRGWLDDDRVDPGTGRGPVSLAHASRVHRWTGTRPVYSRASIDGGGLRRL